MGFLVVSTEYRSRRRGSGVQFQSRLGFSGRLDLLVLTLTPVEDLFQSRLGFSGRLDITTALSRRNLRSSFNPVLGFLVVSTPTQTTQRCPARRVSIPSWVFWSSRRSGTPAKRATASTFQSRLGFSGRLDSPGETYPTYHPRVSIPSWVFWSSRHIDTPGDTRTPTEFQSRLGFSGRLDVWNPGKEGNSVNVSIPSWVFWSSRRRGRILSQGLTLSFNPVLGFLVVSTQLEAGDDLDAGFNPVLGFLVVSTKPRSVDRHRCPQVSIPSWVFWSSRHTALNSKHAVAVKFQSRLGFSGRLDSSRRHINFQTC